MLKVKPVISVAWLRATESGRNGNEAVAGAASETFPSWPHH